MQQKVQNEIQIWTLGPRPLVCFEKSRQCDVLVLQHVMKTLIRLLDCSPEPSMRSAVDNLMQVNERSLLIEKQCFDNKTPQSCRKHLY